MFKTQYISAQTEDKGKRLTVESNENDASQEENTEQHQARSCSPDTGPAWVSKGNILSTVTGSTSSEETEVGMSDVLTELLMRCTMSYSDFNPVGVRKFVNAHDPLLRLIVLPAAKNCVSQLLLCTMSVGINLPGHLSFSTTVLTPHTLLHPCYSTFSQFLLRWLSFFASDVSQDDTDRVFNHTVQVTGYLEICNNLRLRWFLALHLAITGIYWLLYMVSKCGITWHVVIIISTFYTFSGLSAFVMYSYSFGALILWCCCDLWISFIMG